MFQACYGTPQAEYYEAQAIFRVLSDDGKPIEGIDVQMQPKNDTDGHVYDSWALGVTDSNGMIHCYYPDYGLPCEFRFSDADSVYASKDTVLNPSNDTIEITLNKL